MFVFVNNIDIARNKNIKGIEAVMFMLKTVTRTTEWNKLSIKNAKLE